MKIFFERMKGFEPSKPSAWEADALPTELHSQMYYLNDFIIKFKPFLEVIPNFSIVCL